MIKFQRINVLYLAIMSTIKEYTVVDDTVFFSTFFVPMDLIMIWKCLALCYKFSVYTERKMVGNKKHAMIALCTLLVYCVINIYKLTSLSFLSPFFLIELLIQGYSILITLVFPLIVFKRVQKES